MTNWHESPLMIVKSADPTIHDGASLKKMLNEIEALLANGYTLKSTTECNGEIFVFLLNESELRGIGRTTADK
ncbi:MAG TPA: hypothetical protein VFY64_01105 [Nitrososphaeraceae archaeon]|nr:hypothetical protein [Nitrososphaeraceae archaeon]